MPKVHLEDASREGGGLDVRHLVRIQGSTASIVRQVGWKAQGWIWLEEVVQQTPHSQIPSSARSTLSARVSPIYNS